MPVDATLVGVVYRPLSSSGDVSKVKIGRFKKYEKENYD